MKKFQEILLIVFNLLFIKYNTADNIINPDDIDISHLGPQAFGFPDLISGENLEKWSIKNNTNPEEQGTYLEGDILFEILEGKIALRDKTKRWPNAKVPYEINGNFTITEMALILKAIDEYHNKTCVQFIRRTNQTDYVSISSKKNGCFSTIGKVGGPQQLNLQAPGCVTLVGTVIHEMMHSIGFFHEHTRYDRDNYIMVEQQNIIPASLFNFNKVSETATTDFNVTYDYGSVMHYSAYTFSKNGNATIIAKMPAKNMGQRYGFSDSDIRKINLMYCETSGQSTTTIRPSPILTTPSIRNITTLKTTLITTHLTTKTSIKNSTLNLTTKPIPSTTSKLSTISTTTTKLTTKLPTIQTSKPAINTTKLTTLAITTKLTTTHLTTQTTINSTKVTTSHQTTNPTSKLTTKPTTNSTINPSTNLPTNVTTTYPTLKLTTQELANPTINPLIFDTTKAQIISTTKLTTSTVTATTKTTTNFTINPTATVNSTIQPKNQHPNQE